ncbi:MAG TPA: site-2 protease family protein [Granulicella sp.]|nr:site-2 protease family protein [Granulicella sp.]
MACPECETLLYGGYLRQLGQLAMQQEQARQWDEARKTWTTMLAWVPAGGKQAEGIAGRIAGIDAQRTAEAKRKADWTRRLGPLAPVAFFLLKAKTFLFALLKFKFLLSFFAFFGLYWALFGWRFGLGFAVSIAIHEFGHYLAARRRGLKADLPVFLPGLGAYVRWYSQGMSLDTLSEIALAGPFAGLIAAAACAGIYISLGGHAGEQVVNRAGARSGAAVWGALAYAGAWLNLINLVPVLGLDGAQATIALNRVQRGLLLAATIAFYAFLHEGVFLFIAAGMAWRLFTGTAPEQPSTPTMVRYMLLFLLLGSLMWMVPNVGRL